jgi:hypothetical protein
MAIIVEEEKNSSNIASFVGWFIIITVVLAAAYYLFLVTPAPAIVTPPPGFNDITPITQINFDPTSVVKSAGFQALKHSIAEPTSTGPVAVGRTDPFVAP